MKVIGIKGNYDKQEAASVYLMADSSLQKDGKPLFLPDFAESFVAYPSLVVRINRLGKNIARRFAPRYYDAVTVGLCVEAQGFKGGAGIAGVDSAVNAFDGAAVLGDFIPAEELGKQENATFSVAVNSNQVAEIAIADMTMDIDSLIEELSKYFTFKIGDILYTGYRKECGFKLSINDVISGKLGNTDLLHFKVK